MCCFSKLPPGACMFVDVVWLRQVFGWHNESGYKFRKMNGWKSPKSTQVKKEHHLPVTIIFWVFGRSFFRAYLLFFQPWMARLWGIDFFWKNKRRRLSLFAIIIWLEADWGNSLSSSSPKCGPWRTELILGATTDIGDEPFEMGEMLWRFWDFWGRWIHTKCNRRIEISEDDSLVFPTKWTRSIYDVFCIYIPNPQETNKLKKHELLGWVWVKPVLVSS